MRGGRKYLTFVKFKYTVDANQGPIKKFSSLSTLGLLKGLILLIRFNVGF